MAKHIHFIGICGTANGAEAIAFRNDGWKVTGSDKGFYPPISTMLDKAGIDYYAGWHPEKMGTPDLVIYGVSSGSKNPETLHAREQGWETIAEGEARGKFFARENSIVVTGTWGKTSTSALLVSILQKTAIDPSYMVGGIMQDGSPSAALTDSKWSVIEGDEYKSSPTDLTPKFVYAKPTHLVLSAVSWDHADVYPTEESYIKVFQDLISSIPVSGLIVASEHRSIAPVLENIRARVVRYGQRESNDYFYQNVKESKDGLTFEIVHESKTYPMESPMLGRFQAENITGAFAMAHEIGIKPETIIEAMSKFSGIKRRLEKRLENGVTVIDDIAHSPEKVRPVLKALKGIYSGKIIAIFEPNSGNRKHESAQGYNNAFVDADEVIIPRLTKLKKDHNAVELFMNGEELVEVIEKRNPKVKVRYEEDDKALVEYVTSDSKPGDVVVFLGSHGFRGMIEEVVERLSGLSVK